MVAVRTFLVILYNESFADFNNILQDTCVQVQEINEINNYPFNYSYLVLNEAATTNFINFGNLFYNVRFKSIAVAS